MDAKWQRSKTTYRISHQQHHHHLHFKSSQATTLHHMPLSIKYWPQHCSKDKTYSVYVPFESIGVCFCLPPLQSLTMFRSSCFTYCHYNFLLLVGVATLFKLRRSNPTLLSSRASYKIKETIIRVGKKKSCDLNCLLSTIKNPMARGILFCQHSITCISDLICQTLFFQPWVSLSFSFSR